MFTFRYEYLADKHNRCMYLKKERKKINSLVLKFVVKFLIYLNNFTNYSNFYKQLHLMKKKIFHE